MINQLQEKYQLSLLLLLASVASLGIFPFVVMRYLAGNITAAIMDMMLILGISALVVHAYYFKKIRIVSAIIAFFINAGLLIVVIANGLDSFLWVYPVFASTFILVKPIEALAINIVASILLIALSDIFNSVSLTSYVVTITMLSMSTFVYASHSAKQFHLLEALNTIDPLTGALNRRAMSLDIKAALASSERNGIEQLLAILDLDYFKAVNDKYGHAAGDQVLKDFVTITTAHIRKYDRLYRFGGEEFVLLIPVTKEQQQPFIANLRATIKQELKTPDGEEITVSLGVAPWVAGTTVETWLQRADDALYLAKSKGRDRAVFNDE
ncbi:GGDEF domain-containing protein [Amphritea sp. 2_MG-2023]|jgi:diguanylate cyclase (GGDEF)-like protein|uniref:GGDEF domain-containing protein n=1 Tax=Amphritea TaxID=515417 RepID=UPI001C069762|nr:MULTISPECIES: GGDEF domain-containing protein [Amphritea]MBU2964909.1 GGDEF domain-containing protein [Amphritea atlantica]MDO6419928.1 GGDEF domain-containing protein [Amphritea sp. 2_MG-2023]MDX2423185.1 GGDEF domain-containing protein [Amphritea sp.]